MDISEFISIEYQKRCDEIISIIIGISNNKYESLMKEKLNSWKNIPIVLLSSVVLEKKKKVKYF